MDKYTFNESKTAKVRGISSNGYSFSSGMTIQHSFGVRALGRIVAQSGDEAIYVEHTTVHSQLVECLFI